jgi:hypothetical protein
MNKSDVRASSQSLNITESGANCNHYVLKLLNEHWKERVDCSSLQLSEVSKNFNQYGGHREVGNTAGTHSEDYSFKPTSSRQLCRMIFFFRGFPPSAPK